jgi:histidinol-phosphate aminotransferase
MFQVKNRIRPGVEHIQPYLPGLSDEDMRTQFGVNRVLHLDANENALGSSPRAIEAIHQALPTLNLYPDGASQALKAAIAAHHGVPVDEVFIGNGSDNILKLIAETFLDPGDEVVSPTPSFPQYGFGAAIMRATVQRVPLVEDFAYDVEALLDAVGPKTKIVFACSPNNPTGTIVTAAQAEWLVDRLPEDVLLVLDLAYNDYSINPMRVVETSRLLRDPRVIILHTFSKLYGLAGLRVGYGLARPEVWNYVNRVREPFNVNRLAQAGAAAALTDETHRIQSQTHAQQSRLFYESLAQDFNLTAAPTEANFIWLGMEDAKRVADALLTYGIMVRAGFPGYSGFMRLTFGTPEENNWVAQAFGRISLQGIVKPIQSMGR